MGSAGENGTGDAWGVGDALRALASPPEWLRVLGSSSTVEEALREAMPELATGRVRLLQCKFKRARLNGGSWEASYRLTVAGPSHDDPTQDGQRVVDLRAELVPPGPGRTGQPTGAAPVGSDGWSCQVPTLGLSFMQQPPDQELPAMQLLTDPGRARVLLEDEIRAGSPSRADLNVAACHPRVARYKPGRRCTVVYELEFPPGAQDQDWPSRVVAKTHDGGEGRAAYDGMRALWASDVRASGAVSIAEPLAFVEDLKILVQGPVPGDSTLKELIESSLGSGSVAGIATLVEPVRRAGRGLAVIHASGAAGGEVVTWEGELAVTRDVLRQLDGPVPGLGAAVGPLLERLEAIALAGPVAPLVPTHRSFRPAQILLDGPDIGFIDFDGYCRSEQGLDLALFRTTLMDLCLRALTRNGDKPLAGVEAVACRAGLEGLSRVFLSGYEDEIGGVPPERLAVWEVLTILADVLACWRKVKFEHLERRLVMLREQLDATAPLFAR